MSRRILRGRPLVRPGSFARGLIVAVVLAVLLTASVCHAEPIRVLVAVGHRFGLVGETPLKHATRDAMRVRDVFVQLGGVKPENAILLQEPTVAALLAALDRAAAIARTHKPEEVTLLFYFSGHGDRERLHLGGERIALQDVNAKLAAMPAALRIVVADACRTADSRGKGVADAEPFGITADGSANATGVVRIQASADGEVAQESDELAGAVFTHYWLTGLSGAADVDADARVTLAESYAFAYSQTLYRSARASGLVQHPVAQIDLREAAPIVMTQMATASAIRMPRATDAHYLVYGLGTRSVVAELWSSPDRVVSLAVPPGKYVVQRRGGGRSAAAQLDVARGEQRDLKATDFQPVTEEVLARKGGELNLRPNELTIGYMAGASSLVSLGHELSARYAYSWDTGWAIGMGVLGGIGNKSAPAQSADVSWLGVDALLERRFSLGPVLLRAGAGPRVLGIFQTLRRDDASRVALAGYESERQFRAIGAGGHALVGLRLSLSSALWMEIEGRGDVLLTQREGTLAPVWGLGAGGAFGLSF